MSTFEISDDDIDNIGNEFSEDMTCSGGAIEISSDEETVNYNLTSDESDELPDVDLTSRKSAVIKNLFPVFSSSRTNNENSRADRVHSTTMIEPSTSTNEGPGTSVQPPLQPKTPEYEKMIAGIKVILPVEPYKCQVTIMNQLLLAIKKSVNCLLESPTGTGKTLALLCGALAWQQHERDRIANIHAEGYFSNHPELHKLDGAKEYIASPMKQNHYSPGKTANLDEVFNKSVGEWNIYSKPEQSGRPDNFSNNKRPGPDMSNSSLISEDDSPGLVTIHKRPKFNDSDDAMGSASNQTTPTKPYQPQSRDETPENVRQLYRLVENLHVRTSLFVGCSLPTIYYGARTHKQLEQVIKEFSRTSYSHKIKMTVLSSRDYTCIREFDKQTWGTKNDMCRGCTKKRQTDDTPIKNEKEVKSSECLFFANREALDHSKLPRAFDLEDLVRVGEELKACPYYAARDMAKIAEIIFCPYNYLIEPSIKKSLQINLTNNIVIIDEAHNIEGTCRDAASFTLTRDSIQAALKEIEVVANYRYANYDVMSYIDNLVKTLKTWDDWFKNQLPLMKNCRVENNEATYTWNVQQFVQTLNNHNIGQIHYNTEFRESVEIFCRKLREDPRTMYGVTQTTGTLLESLDLVLGYLFREDCKYMDDYTPILVKTTYNNQSWRKSQSDDDADKVSLSLRLLCMHPGVVFAALASTRCVVLASGTLTPTTSLKSELAASFPHTANPAHVIPKDRVWVGSLGVGASGNKIICTKKEMDQASTQDDAGAAVLRVCEVTPHGVLVFLTSYGLMNRLIARWQKTGLWSKLCKLKNVFTEQSKAKEHNEIMDDYYETVSTQKGAVLFAVFRGKVSEGMDFRDQQARAVVVIGVPFPNIGDPGVKAKKEYNNKYTKTRQLLSGEEWLRVQTFRALNQALGRCVRHARDWGAVLLVDDRFGAAHYTEPLSKWLRDILRDGNNHHSFDSLCGSDNGLDAFMERMAICDNEDDFF